MDVIEIHNYILTDQELFYMPSKLRCGTHLLLEHRRKANSQILASLELMVLTTWPREHTRVLKHKSNLIYIYIYIYVEVNVFLPLLYTQVDRIVGEGFQFITNLT